METLVEIAKRLGIKPNPQMSKEDYVEVVEHQLAPELQKMWRYSKRDLVVSPLDLWSSIYNIRKKVIRHVEKNQLLHNLDLLRTKSAADVFIHNQDGEPIVGNEDAIFIWHSARSRKRNLERFVADIKIDSPRFSEVMERLDEFIKKYDAGFKVTDFYHKDRTDTLNVYMGHEITPENAAELYEILRPVLNKENNDYLDGQQVMMAGEPVMGFKFGAEPIYVRELARRSQIREQIRRRAERDLDNTFFAKIIWNDAHLLEHSSLGMVAAKEQWVDLLYYLSGKEGKNPFCVGNQFGESDKYKYDKVIDIGGLVKTKLKKDDAVLKMSDEMHNLERTVRELLKNPQTEEAFDRLKAFINKHIEKGSSLYFDIRNGERSKSAAIYSDMLKVKYDGFDITLMMDGHGQVSLIYTGWNEKAYQLLSYDIKTKKLDTIDKMEGVKFGAYGTPISCEKELCEYHAKDGSYDQVECINVKFDDKCKRISAEKEIVKHYDRNGKRMKKSDTIEYVVNSETKEKTTKEGKMVGERVKKKSGKSIKNAIARTGAKPTRTVRKTEVVEMPDLTTGFARNCFADWENSTLPLDDVPGFDKLFQKILDTYRMKKGSIPWTELNAFIIKQPNAKAYIKKLMAMAEIYSTTNDRHVPIIKVELLVKKPTSKVKKTKEEEKKPKPTVKGPKPRIKKPVPTPKPPVKKTDGEETFEFDVRRRIVTRIVTKGNKRTVQEIWLRPNPKIAARYTHEEIKNKDGKWVVKPYPAKDVAAKGAPYHYDSKHNMAYVDNLNEKETARYTAKLEAYAKKVAKDKTEESMAVKAILKEGITYAFDVKKRKGEKETGIVTKFETIKTATGFRRIVTEYHVDDKESKGKVGQARYLKAFTHIEEFDKEGRFLEERLPIAMGTARDKDKFKGKEGLRQRLADKTSHPTVEGDIDYDNTKHLAKVTYMTDGEKEQFLKILRNRSHYKIEGLVIPPGTPEHEDSEPVVVPPIVRPPKPPVVVPQPVNPPEPAPVVVPPIVKPPKPEPAPDPKPEEKEPIDWRDLKWKQVDRKGYGAHVRTGRDDEEVVRFLDASSLTDEAFIQMANELYRAGIKFMDPRINIPGSGNELTSKVITEKSMTRKWWNQVVEDTSKDGRALDQLSTFRSGAIQSAVDPENRTVVVAGGMDISKLNKLMRNKRPNWFKRHWWLMPIMGLISALWAKFSPMQDRGEHDREEAKKEYVEPGPSAEENKETPPPKVPPKKIKKVAPKAPPLAEEDWVFINGHKVSKKDLVAVTVSTHMFAGTKEGMDGKRRVPVYPTKDVTIYVSVDSLVRDFSNPNGDIKKLLEIVNNIKTGKLQIVDHSGRVSHVEDVKAKLVDKDGKASRLLHVHSEAEAEEMAKHGVKLHTLADLGVKQGVLTSETGKSFSRIQLPKTR